MPIFAHCECEQLSLEVSDNPTESSQQVSPTFDGFTYFDNDSVVGTTGEAHCITMHGEVDGSNLYYCNDCQTALFCVSLNNPSIIGVMKECFRKAIVLDFFRNGKKADHPRTLEAQDRSIAKNTSGLDHTPAA